MYRDIPQDLRELIEPVVEASGSELVDVTISRGRAPWLLRITVDTPEGDGRVSVERCAEISREVETHLDASDAIERSYRLEVSSPGLDRLLAREKDFRAACGGEVSIETRRPLAGRRRFRGRLESFDGRTARVVVDGTPVEVPFAEVARARSIYEVTPADFSAPGLSGSRRRR